MLGKNAVGNPFFVGRMRRGSSPKLRTVDRGLAWMRANAKIDELCAVCERLANMADPLAATMEHGPFIAQDPTLVGTERERKMHMNKELQELPGYA